MPDLEPTISFRLPSGKTADVFVVKLADGRIVARTPDELAEMPASAAPAAPQPATPRPLK